MERELKKRVRANEAERKKWEVKKGELEKKRDDTRRVYIDCQQAVDLAKHAAYAERNRKTLSMREVRQNELFTAEAMRKTAVWKLEKHLEDEEEILEEEQGIEELRERIANWEAEEAERAEVKAEKERAEEEELARLVFFVYTYSCRHFSFPAACST